MSDNSFRSIIMITIMIIIIKKPFTATTNVYQMYDLQLVKSRISYIF